MHTAKNVLAKVVLASAMAISICLPAAVAQQGSEGTITGINRLNGTIAIQQSGTVGSASAPAAEEFKVQDGKLLEDIHAGDRVTFSVSEGNGLKTITRLERLKL
jgi:Cu/Ag efflux protein CusF